MLTAKCNNWQIIRPPSSQIIFISNLQGIPKKGGLENATVYVLLLIWYRLEPVLGESL